MADATLRLTRKSGEVTERDVAWQITLDDIAAGTIPRGQTVELPSNAATTPCRSAPTDTIARGAPSRLPKMRSSTSPAGRPCSGRSGSPPC